MAIIKKTATNAKKAISQKEHTEFWWKCKLVQPLWKSVWKKKKEKKKSNNKSSPMILLLLLAYT
jgi:hypothetical protein